MVEVKKMDEVAYAKLVKEVNALGEQIRSRQDEKQAVLDDFDAERGRYLIGKISEATLASSAQKTNKTTNELDNSIKKHIAMANELATRMKKFAAAQAPKKFTASVAGIKGASSGKSSKKSPKKKAHHAKTAKQVASVKPSKTILKKEISLDKKAQAK